MRGSHTRGSVCEVHESRCSCVCESCGDTGYVTVREAEGRDVSGMSSASGSGLQLRGDREEAGRHLYQYNLLFTF